MTKDELLALYQKRKENFSKTLSQVSKRINLISNLRLATALTFIIVLYFSFTTTALLFPVGILLLLFIYFVQKHAFLFDEKTHLENLVKINQAEIDTLQGQYSNFDNGSQFIDPHHPYSHDLDLFGEGSLFQYLNRCNTLDGKKIFAQRLSSPLGEKKLIEANQQAIREATPKIDFRQHFQASGMEIIEAPQDRSELFEWLTHPSFIYHSKMYHIILIVLPAVTILSVIGAFFSPLLKSLAIFFAIIQWSLLGLNLKKVNAFHEYISKKKNILEKYAKLLSVLKAEGFASTLFQETKESASEADVKLKRLASLVSALNARLNSFMNLFVNSILLYDLQCVYRLEKWKAENAKNLPLWLESITQAEVLCSFANYTFNNSSFRFPEIHSELSIIGKELAHPLLTERERVSNNFSIGNKQTLQIITGANMAGKSTFLRTLGINLILALNGAPVCATSFICPVINLRTGMRTADSLKDHQSYFYAELDRLKTIMDELRSDKPLLILLDEILKGTNSTDKQSGSIALVKQLLPHPCLAVIATHDLALGALENEYPGQVQNFCFEATIENDQLSFDYKLKPGLAQKMNATFLMKKMGIIPS
jgi:ABC-type multidrug transport system fused ATPase/permease subunit